MFEFQVDVPIFNGVEISTPLGFDSSCATDVPEDLLAVTPINGWDAVVSTDPVNDLMIFSPFDDLELGPMLTSEHSTAKGAHYNHNATVFDSADDVLSQASDILSNASSVSSSDDETTLLDTPEQTTSRSRRGAGPRGSRSNIMKKRGPSRAVLGAKLRAIAVKAESANRVKNSSAAIAQAAAEVTLLRETNAIEDPEARRLTHNVLERKRRNDLKMSYKKLRRQLPKLADNERCPTGQILIHAVDTIKELRTQQEALEASLRDARARRQRLLASLGRL